MANLWWITVTLTFFLSAGCLAAVDQNQLAPLIQQIRALGIGRGTIYSVAVSIYKEENSEYIIKERFLPKEADIKNINGGQVYSNNRLVAAIQRKPEHAEWRVLKELKKKLDKNQFEGGDLLVIFSSASPCGTSCAKEGGNYSILGKLSTLTLIEEQKIDPNDKTIKKMKKWTNYAFVFEKVFQPGGTKIAEGKLKEALNNIGKYIRGLANVFRCYDPKANTGFKCVSCSSRGEVIKQCVDYDA